MAACSHTMAEAVEQHQLLLPEPIATSASAAPSAAVRRSRRAVLAALAAGCLLAATACLLTSTRSGGGFRSGPETDVGGLHDEDVLSGESWPQDIMSKFGLRLPQLWPPQASPQCRAKLERLERLHAGTRELKPGGAHDPDFPPNMTSIGRVGTCGDSAQGISEDCTKYNHWSSMQEVAHRYYKDFSVFKPGGVQYHDIGQGRLGTCYFLGALASIARTSPHIIEEMFVRRELWQDNIFTTKWLIDEQETLIEVDDMMPASEDNIAFFVQPSSTGEFWPAILEKAWAKIHVNFAAIEGGFWPMPVMAITRAPVRTYYHKVGLLANLRHLLKIFHYTSKSKLWEKMVCATTNNHPMAASTSGTQGRATKYGLANSHLYSVFQAYTSQAYGKVVDVFNPWNSDKYHGTIPNPSLDDGLFTMTLDEFFDAFSSTYFAEVLPGYKSSAKRIQHGQEDKWSHHNFEVKHVPRRQSFFVSLNWPAHRLVKPCPMLNPDVTFEVVKTDEHGRHISETFHGKRDGRVVNSLSAEVTAGAGNYHVLVNGKFNVKGFVDELYVSVYAPEEVNITEIAGIAQGDRFQYGPWGGPCVATWVHGELWMRSEAGHSTSGAKIFKTKHGAGAKLAEGERVEVEWENSKKVKAHMVDDTRIRIDNGGAITYFERMTPEPIPGSENWWTCKHDDMFVCGSGCCCENSKWIAARQTCRPI